MNFPCIFPLEDVATPQSYLKLNLSKCFPGQEDFNKNESKPFIPYIIRYTIVAKSDVRGDICF